MLDVLFRGARRSPAPARRGESAGYADLIDWLQAGRLTLVDEGRNAVTAEQWAELPASVRANALADFRRVVRGNAKAAVIFLRD
jgi:hypothetical protein